MKNIFPSVVIAAFNEEENIERLTKLLLKTLKTYQQYEIIYVVAGTDSTKKLIEDFHDTRIKIIYSSKPSGLGADFKKGFAKVSKNADYVITMDADLNHQPEEIPRLLEKANEFDIVVGSRHVSGSVRQSIPFWKRIISDFTNTVFSIASGIKIHDKTSGFRVYKKNVIDQLAKKYKRNNFEFLLELLLIAKRLNYTMTEIPITFVYRTEGKSKFKVFTTFYGYFTLLMQSKRIK